MKCPRCEQSLEVQPEQRGTTIRCPNCAKKVKIPPAKKKAPQPLMSQPVAPPPPPPKEDFEYMAEASVKPQGKKDVPPPAEQTFEDRLNAPLPISWQRTRQGLILLSVAIGVLALGFMIAIIMAFANDGSREILPSFAERSLAPENRSQSSLAVVGVTIVTMLIGGVFVILGLLRCSSIPEKTGASGLAVASAVATGFALLFLLVSVGLFAFSEGRYIALSIFDILMDTSTTAAIFLFVIFLTMTALAMQHRSLGMIATSLMLFVILIPIVVQGINKLLFLTQTQEGKQQDLQSIARTIQILIIIAIVIVVIWMEFVIIKLFQIIPGSYRRGKI